MADIANLTAGLTTLGPSEAWTFLKPLLLFVIGMAVYAIFIFKLYRFVARRDIFKLNLRQYSKSKYPAFQKFLAGIFYAVEYILLFPLFSFFWFAVFTVLLTFLAREQTIQNILLVSIAIVSAIRVTAYYNEDLSKDLAKMLPFALLGIFLVDISFFSLAQSWGVIQQIPSLWKALLYYLVFVIILEFILRIGYSLFRKKST